MQKALWGVAVLLYCSACGVPSLRYKYEVNKLAAQGKFEQAADLISSKRRTYGMRDIILFNLDRASLLHDGQQPAQSDELLAQAQQQITDSYTQSISAHAAQFIVNDLTVPYNAADYETALTFFYRAMNFLDQKDVRSAAVEARKAVFFLDHLRGGREKGYIDDPFVQYVASLVFESVGELSDARIARQNALNAYQRYGWPIPQFHVPANAQEYGEVIIFHYAGQVPLKKNQTIQLSWHDALAFANSPAENGGAVSPEVQNAIYAGITGSAVTVSYPVLEAQPYYAVSSTARVNGQQIPLQKMTDVASLLKQDLDAKLPGIWFRTASRAVIKRMAAVQARHAVEKAEDKKDGSWGWLAEMMVSVLGSATEKADTRQWFTLPAAIYMTRVFVTPGTQQISLLLRDENGNIINEHAFENITVRAGERVFLHHRTAY